MNQEQLEVINIVQEVLRCIVISAIALNPTERARFAGALQTMSGGPALSPMAQRMLQDLAEGAAMISSAGQVKQ